MSAIALPHKKRRGLSETLKNFWLDIALFIAFVIDMNVRFTDIPIHEWLGVAFGIVLIYHLLLHWDWVLGITRRMVSKLPAVERLRYFLDIALFIDMLLLIATGLWISEVVIRQLGWQVSPNFLWRRLHSITADLAILIVALHIGLSWTWISNAFKRYIWQPLRRPKKATTVA